MNCPMCGSSNVDTPIVDIGVGYVQSEPSNCDDCLAREADVDDYMEDATDFERSVHWYGGIMSVSQWDLVNWFKNHPPANATEVARYDRIREAGRIFAMTIREETPVSADQSVAIRKVREAVWSANASIACASGVSDEPQRY